MRTRQLDPRRPAHATRALNINWGFAVRRVPLKRPAEDHLRRDGVAAPDAPRLYQPAVAPAFRGSRGALIRRCGRTLRAGAKTLLGVRLERLHVLGLTARVVTASK